MLFTLVASICMFGFGHWIAGLLLLWLTFAIGSNE